MATGPMAGERVTVPGYVVARVMRDAAVLLNTRTGRYFRLDDIGMRTWTLLSSSPSLGDVYESLLLEYDVSAEELRRDVEALVERLVAEGLLERAGG